MRDNSGAMQVTVGLEGADRIPRRDSDEPDAVRRIAERLPRPLRFLAVGGVGLLTDLSIFTLIAMQAFHPLSVRAVSLAVATLVTWRLNRALTFDRSGRHQSDEALRYAGVTAVAQGTSYTIFAALVLTLLSSLPQAAIVAGAAAGALVAYNGHRLFAFAPRKLRPNALRSGAKQDVH
jgi:putative flippase GtrA